MRTRLYIVAQVTAGGTSVTVAQTLGCARSTVVRVMQRYRELGLSGLEDRRQGNGQRKILPSVRLWLWTLVDQSPHDYGYARSTWTRELLGRVVAEHLKVELSVTTIGRVLRAMDVVRRRVRPALASRCSRRVFRAFRRKLEELLRRSSPDDAVLYVDEIDIHLNPKLGFDWMRRGHQKVVATPGKNEKRHLAGALHATTGHVVWVTSERKNSRLFIELLKKASRSYRRARRIHLILDNYSAHTSWETQRFLDRLGPRFELHFLPAYGQVLNVVERLWKQVHDNITRNHRYTTIRALLQAVEAFLFHAIPFPGSRPSLARTSR
jgi:putative transposase